MGYLAPLFSQKYQAEVKAIVSRFFIYCGPVTSSELPRCIASAKHSGYTFVLSLVVQLLYVCARKVTGL